jgi:hypothetical protein
MGQVKGRVMGSKAKLWGNGCFELMTLSVDTLMSDGGKLAGKVFDKNGILVVQKENVGTGKSTPLNDILNAVSSNGRSLHYLQKASFTGSNFRPLHTSFADEGKPGRYLAIRVSVPVTMQATDGFKVAYDLMNNCPDVAEYLIFHHLDYCRPGSMDVITHHPIIKCDVNRNVTQIIFDNTKRSPPSNIHESSHFYRNLKQFYSAIYQAENMVEFDILPGETLVVDNHRVLLGNTASVSRGEELEYFAQ